MLTAEGTSVPKSRHIYLNFTRHLYTEQQAADWPSFLWVGPRIKTEDGKLGSVVARLTPQRVHLFLPPLLQKSELLM